jgi:hypothetical protein
VRTNAGKITIRLAFNCGVRPAAPAGDFKRKASLGGEKPDTEPDPKPSQRDEKHKVVPELCPAAVPAHRPMIFGTHPRLPMAVEGDHEKHMDGKGIALGHLPPALLRM